MASFSLDFFSSLRVSSIHIGKNPPSGIISTFFNEHV